MIVKADSDYGVNHILVNGKYGEILNVEQFDTESKEAIITLRDKSGQAILNVNKESIKVRVVIPLAKLEKVK